MPRSSKNGVSNGKRHMLTTRLPRPIWKRLRSLSTNLSHKEERNVSCNEVLIRLIRNAPLR